MKPLKQRNFNAISTQFKQKILIPIILLCPFSFLFSQIFLSESVVTDANLSSQQSYRKQIFENSSYVVSAKIIEIGDLPNLVSNGILEFQLPNSSDLLKFEAYSIKSFPNGDYSFSADLIQITSPDQILSGHDVAGDLIMIKRGNKIFGDMRIEESSYRINDLGGNLSLLVKINTDQSSNEPFCDVVGNNFIQGLNTPSSNQNSVNFSDFDNEKKEGLGCLVRLLVLYTEAALVARPDIEDFIDVQYGNLEDILSKSKVFSEDLRIKKVGVGLLDADIWAETGDVFPDAENIAETQGILDLRDAYKADIVIVMTGEVYGTTLGIVTEIGENATFADKAFGIVVANDKSSENYVFSHEIGHLFGAHHEGTDLCVSGGDDTGIVHAHGYHPQKESIIQIHTKRKRTVMSICFSNLYGAIKHFSNPNVEWKGGYTGKNNTNYNAKVLRDEACRVSEYVVEYFTDTYIAGPNEACIDLPLTLIASTIGNQGIPSYQWRTSYNGFVFNGPVESTNSSFMITLTGNVGQILYIQLIVGNGTSDEQILTHQIQIIDEGCQEFNGKSLGVDNSKGIVNGFLIFPNPSSSKEINIHLPDSNDASFEISFIDISGRILKSVILSESTSKSIAISELPIGIYTVVCQSENQISFSKIIIQK